MANDMVDVPYPFFKVESDDITRTMMQVGLARLDSSTELLPQTQLWSKLGGSLLWEKGAKYNIKVNGEDFFAVKEKTQLLGRLEGAVGLATRLATAGESYALTLRTALEGFAYVGSRDTRLTSSARGASASTRARTLARYEGRYNLGLQLHTPYGDLGVNAGLGYDTEGGRSREVMGTFYMTF